MRYETTDPTTIPEVARDDGLRLFDLRAAIEANPGAESINLGMGTRQGFTSCQTLQRVIVDRQGVYLCFADRNFPACRELDLYSLRHQSPRRVSSIRRRGWPVSDLKAFLADETTNLPVYVALRRDFSWNGVFGLAPAVAAGPQVFTSERDDDTRVYFVETNTFSIWSEACARRASQPAIEEAAAPVG